MSDSYIVHFASLNAQGLREVSKRERPKHRLAQQRVDIKLLQETHFTVDLTKSIPGLPAQFDKRGNFNCFGKSNSCGCNTFIRKKPNHKTLNNIVSESVRL